MVEASNEISSKTEEVTFVCISDTHNDADFFPMPEGDVLIHAGDFTNLGLPKEVAKFNKFLEKHREKFKYIIVIAGNHDITFDTENYEISLKNQFHRYFEKFDHKEVKSSLKNCIYLEDSSCEVFGYKVYGSPWTPEFYSWGFNLPRGKELREIWSKIPSDTDILITHGPPYGIGDNTYSNKKVGDVDLLEEIKNRIKPLYHIFGHIHENAGVFKEDGVTFINASMIDRKGFKSPRDVITFKLPKLKEA